MQEAGRAEVPGRGHGLTGSPTCVAVGVSKVLGSVSVGVQDADGSVLQGKLGGGRRQSGRLCRGRRDHSGIGTNVQKDRDDGRNVCLWGDEGVRQRVLGDRRVSELEWAWGTVLQEAAAS